MTPDELRKHFPGASDSTLRRNQADHPQKGSELEHHSENESVGAILREEGFTDGPAGCDKKSDRPGIILTYTLYLTRPLDPENCATKFFTDGLRYASALRDDRPQDIDLRIRQVQVATRSEEKTEITIAPAEPK